MKVSRIALVVGLSLLAAPATAAAQSAAPPGNSAVEQYRESAPPAGPGSGKLDDRKRRALERRGADGAALAAALDRTGGVPDGAERATDGADGTTRGRGAATAAGTRGSGKDSGSGKGSASSPARETASDSGRPAGSDPAPATERPADETSATNAAATSTVGPFPVWVMVLAAFAVVGAGLVVRRRASS